MKPGCRSYTVPGNVPMGMSTDDSLKDLWEYLDQHRGRLPKQALG